jgi:FkbM family methyltransferase
MPANSLPRKVVKSLLYPLANEHLYQYFQAVSKAWDIRSGNWHEPELELISSAVKEGETALDIGANFGVYSYHLSRIIGKQGQVYAFEPVPFTYSTLKVVSKVLRFRNVKLVPKGCSDKSGKIRFTVPLQNSGAFMAGQAFISRRNDEHEGKESQVRWQSTKEVDAEVVAIDQFLPDISNLTLIKCDIEGAELLAFRGAERLINKNLPTVICEINPWYLEGFGLKLEDLTGFFFNKGYRMYFYSGKESSKLKLIEDLKEVVEDNYVFIHPRYLDRFKKFLN